jgi:hypothetical protein
MAIFGSVLSKSGKLPTDRVPVQSEGLEIMPDWFSLRSGVYLASFFWPDKTV